MNAAQRSLLLHTLGLLAGLLLIDTPCAVGDYAQEHFWVLEPPASGDWFEATNWIGGVPVPTGHWTLAEIDNGGTARIESGLAGGHDLFVGIEHLGKVVQTGGESDGGRLTLGRDPAAKGDYVLSGDGLLDRGEILVGDQGTGLLQQDGGCISGSSWPGTNMYLGNQPTGNGVWNMEEGCAGFYYLKIGVAGTGHVTQAGGDVNCSAYAILGVEASGYGRYTLTGGRLDSSYYTTRVGYRGTGEFVQEGGSHYPDDLHLGVEAEGNGTYWLKGGNLSTDGLSVGVAGSGTFCQTGGTDYNSGRLTIGSRDGGRGLFELSGSDSVCKSKHVYLGADPGSFGRFVQTGGTHKAITLQVGGPSLGVDPGGGEGVYEFRGGSLGPFPPWSIDCYVSIGNEGRGEFYHDGGNAQFTELTICTSEDAYGHYSFTSGSLVTETLTVGEMGEASFAMVGTSGTVSVSAQLTFGPTATFTAVPGSAVHMTGAAFENESTDPDALAGLGNLELIFEGGPADTDPVEVAGEDRGPVWDGFVGNFTFGGLAVGGTDVGQIQLVDESDNGNRGGPAGADEAQYVKRLRVGPGCTLDLGGLNLYCLSSAIDPSATILTGSGSLTKVPAVDAVSATALATTFSPTGGAHGLGTLALSDVADIVLETDDGLQTTYPGGTVILQTFLFSDDSSGGLASGLFRDGTLLFMDAGGDDLLAADLLELLLQEMPDQHLLAGSGRFEITGGSLQGGFPVTVGEVVQITFQMGPSGIADFASAFTATSDVTLTPEPATLALLAAGAAGVWMRKRRGPFGSAQGRLRDGGKRGRRPRRAATMKAARDP